MSSHVVLDVALETLVAHFTLVHLLALVERENVPFQSVSSWIRLFTQMTLELFAILM